MSDVYFEAMEYHNLERDARAKEHLNGYEKWVEENAGMYEHIHSLVDKGLPLGEEELTFLMRHSAENIYNRAFTAELDFFAHHFQRVDRQRRNDELLSQKEQTIEAYREGLKDILKIQNTLFKGRANLEKAQSISREALLKR